MSNFNESYNQLHVQIYKKKIVFSFGWTTDRNVWILKNGALPDDKIWVVITTDHVVHIKCVKLDKKTEKKMDERERGRKWVKNGAIWTPNGRHLMNRRI